jgi:hypothetical protein
MIDVQATEAVPEVGLAEHVRRLAAAPIALIASALGVVCVASVPDVLPALDDFALVDDRFVGWAGVGAVVGVVVAAVSLLAAGWLGSGPALSIGAAAAVFGLALANDVVDPFQLSLGQVLLGAAVGCLLGGAASMTFELPVLHLRLVMVAWTVPLLAAWPLLAWSGHQAAPSTADATARLTEHPSVWLLAPASVLIVVWSAMTMLLEPERTGIHGGDDWESAWSGLLAITLGGGLAVMVLGYDTGLTAGWLRPLVLLSSATVIVTLAAATMLVPTAEVRVGYVCLGFVTLCFPITVQLLVLVADSGRSRVDGWVVALLVVAVRTGAAVGGLRPGVSSIGFLVVAAGCAGAWVMPDAPWLMAAGAAPLSLGMGAVFGAGVREVSGSAVGWRFAAMAVIAIVLLGTVSSMALSWALGGDVPTDVDSARAAGRVFLGLTFALGVMAAAAVFVLTPPRLRETSVVVRRPS